MNELKYEKREVVKLILLNNKNIVLKIKDISYGGTNFAMIEPKEILSEIGILCGGFFARERKAYSESATLPPDRIVFKPYTDRNTTINIVKNHIKRLKISSTEVKYGKITVTVDGTKYSISWGTGTAEYETELKLLRLIESDGLLYSFFLKRHKICAIRSCFYPDAIYINDIDIWMEAYSCSDGSKAAIC